MTESLAGAGCIVAAMRAAAVAMLILAACEGSPEPSPAPVPLTFRRLTATRNVLPCIAGPEFRIATDEAAWIDLYDEHTACSGTAEIRLPPVRFPDEVVLAGWWGIEPCPGRQIIVRSVALDGTAVVVAARSEQPARACVGSIGPESILAVERPTSISSARFTLDGETIGEAVAAPTSSPAGT